MEHANQRANFLLKRLESLKLSAPDPQVLVERDRQLRQSVDIMNQLINENSHRPESIRLLRKILRERAELQLVLEKDETSLSG